MREIVWNGDTVFQMSIWKHFVTDSSAAEILNIFASSDLVSTTVIFPGTQQPFKIHVYLTLPYWSPLRGHSCSKLDTEKGADGTFRLYSDFISSIFVHIF